MIENPMIKIPLKIKFSHRSVMKNGENKAFIYQVGKLNMVRKSY